MPPRITKEELAQRVKNAWQPGDTQAMIGKRLGMSASSIGGVYHRNPEMRTTHPVSGSFHKAKPTTPQARNTFEQRAARLDALRAVRTAPAIEVMEAPGQYTLTTLPANGCKWPHGDKLITFCGCTRAEGKSYCADHQRRAYQVRMV